MTYQVLFGYVKQGQKLKKPSEHLWVCLRVSVIAFADATYFTSIKHTML